MDKQKRNSKDNKPLVDPKENENKEAVGPENEEKEAESNFSSYGISVPRKAAKNKSDNGKSSSGKSSVMSWLFGKR